MTMTMTMTRHRRSLAACILLAACRPPATDLPACQGLVSTERAVESDTRMLPPAGWSSLLIRGARQPALDPPPELRECSGHTITARPPGPGLGPEPALLPSRPLGESDLTFAPAPDGQLLVWARVQHYADGTARGPVALVRWVARGVEVRGIGTLWAPTRRVRLRLEQLGELALLVADSERCASDLPSSCARELQLLTLVGQRFMQVDLHEEGALPESRDPPARIATYERTDTPLDDGWIRRADVSRHVQIRGARIAIAEELRVRDCDPSAVPELCSERLRVREERPLTWRDGRFSAPASAWAQVAGP